MKVVVAMDSFKESLTALEACQAVSKGLKEVWGENCQTLIVPMADGGEGTVQSLVDATNGKIIFTKATDPLGNKIDAFFGLLGDQKTAVIEMAAASGLELVPPNKRNPLLTTTLGTGELILEAIAHGAKTIVLGIGGSATNDAGVGMATALGVQFLDENENSISPCGGELHKIKKIDISQLNPKVKDVEFIVACDVDNPLTGKRGASFVFGPQKGATAEMAQTLDDNLKHFAQMVTCCLGKDIDQIAGAGAAGGLGAAAIAFLNGALMPGIDIVVSATGLMEHVKDADFVITGEGKIDQQTAFGKTPMGVAKVAKKFGVPVIALAGSLGEHYEDVFHVGIDSVFSIVPGVCNLEEALANGKSNLQKTARNMAKLIALGIDAKHI